MASFIGKKSVLACIIMSSNIKLPWIIKYRPKSLKDYVNQEEAVTIFTSWIKEWEKKVPLKRAVLLYGPPGVGKTSLIEVVANEYNMEIIETNASDYRRREDIARKVRTAALQGSLSGKRKIILLDEVDGLSSLGDKGGIEAIQELISITKHPIVMTANNAYHPDLRPIREQSILIEVKKLGQREVLPLLKKVCERENVTCEDEALKIIYTKNSGDLRAILNDLQSIAEVFGKVTTELATELTYYRDRQLNPFDTLRIIFSSKYIWQSKNAVSHSEVDPDTLIEWLSENVPNQLSDPEDVYLAFEVLSRADVYRGRIVKSGNWDFLSHVIELIGPSISFSRKKSKYKWVGYRYPQKLKQLSETKRNRELLKNATMKISQRVHCSTECVKREVLPIIRSIYKLNPHYAVKLLRSYDIEPDEASVIVGTTEISSIYSEAAAKPGTAEPMSKGAMKKKKKGSSSASRESGGSLS